MFALPLGRRGRGLLGGRFRGGWFEGEGDVWGPGREGAGSVGPHPRGTGSGAADGPFLGGVGGGAGAESGGAGLGVEPSEAHVGHLGAAEGAAGELHGAGAADGAGAQARREVGQLRPDGVLRANQASAPRLHRFTPNLQHTGGGSASAADEDTDNSFHVVHGAPQRGQITKI